MWLTGRWSRAARTQCSIHSGGHLEVGSSLEIDHECWHCFWFVVLFFFFSSRRRHTRFKCDWSSDVCSSDLDLQRQHFLRLGHDRRGGGDGTLRRSFELTTVVNRRRSSACSLASSAPTSLRVIWCVRGIRCCNVATPLGVSRIVFRLPSFESRAVLMSPRALSLATTSVMVEPSSEIRSPSVRWSSADSP